MRSNDIAVFPSRRPPATASKSYADAELIADTRGGFVPEFSRGDGISGDRLSALASGPQKVRYYCNRKRPAFTLSGVRSGTIRRFGVTTLG
jgi:hypothetical protein